jgi:hypothetical protein
MAHLSKADLIKHLKANFTMKNLTLPFCSLLAVTLPAFADIQYTTVMSMNQDGKLTPLSTVTTSLKKGLQRDDTEQKIGPVTRSESVITNVARREQISLDPALKIYTVVTLGGDAGGHEKSDIAVTAVKPAKGTGKMVMTLGAQFIGNEKLLDYPVRHYKTSMQTDSNGCVGDSHTVMKTEQWMADLELPVLDDNAKAQGFGGYGDNQGDCKITFERNGDVNGFDAAQKGLALKRITFDEAGKILMQQQITMLSLAALTDERFAAPANFKKLSRADYEKARQDAMMKAFTQPDANEADDEANEVEEAEEENAEEPEAPAKPAAKQKAKNKLRLPF